MCRLTLSDLRSPERLSLRAEFFSDEPPFLPSPPPFLSFPEQETAASTKHMTMICEAMRVGDMVHLPFGSVGFQLLCVSRGTNGSHATLLLLLRLLRQGRVLEIVGGDVLHRGVAVQHQTALLRHLLLVGDDCLRTAL